MTAEGHSDQRRWLDLCALHLSRLLTDKASADMMGFHLAKRACIHIPSRLDIGKCVFEIWCAAKPVRKLGDLSVKAIDSLT